MSVSTVNDYESGVGARTGVVGAGAGGTGRPRGSRSLSKFYLIEYV